MRLDTTRWAASALAVGAVICAGVTVAGASGPVEPDAAARALLAKKRQAEAIEDATHEAAFAAAGGHANYGPSVPVPESCPTPYPPAKAGPATPDQLEPPDGVRAPGFPDALEFSASGPSAKGHGVGGLFGSKVSGGRQTPVLFVFVARISFCGGVPGDYNSLGMIRLVDGVRTTGFDVSHLLDADALVLPLTTADGRQCQIVIRADEDRLDDPCTLVADPAQRGLPLSRLGGTPPP